MLSDVLYRAGELLGGARAGGEEGEVATDAMVGAAGAWLLSRLLRPKPVRWPRVIMAGVAGALVSELMGRAEEESPPADEVPHAESAAQLAGRVAAGVAVAAGYASILYPRLPGPPLLKGLAFGALEVAAAPRGGLARLAAGVPGIRFPLQALATPVDEDASPLTHLAFGLALGLLYRDAENPDVEEYDEDDEDDDYDD